MDNLQQAAKHWRAEGEESARFLRASAALQLMVGLDLKTILAAPLDARRTILPRIKLALRREHLRGIARHWSYDLSRHIALKQALDYVVTGSAGDKTKTATPRAAVFTD